MKNYSVILFGLIVLMSLVLLDSAFSQTRVSEKKSQKQIGKALNENQKVSQVEEYPEQKRSPIIHRGEILLKQQNSSNSFFEKNFASIVALFIAITGTLINYFLSKKSIDKSNKQIEIARETLIQQKEIADMGIKKSVRSRFRQERMKDFQECLSELLTYAALYNQLLQKEWIDNPGKQLDKDHIESKDKAFKNIMFYRKKINLLFYDMDDNASMMNNDIGLFLNVISDPQKFDIDKFHEYCNKIVELGKRILKVEWEKVICLE